MQQAGVDVSILEDSTGNGSSQQAGVDVGILKDSTCQRR